MKIIIENVSKNYGDKSNLTYNKSLNRFVVEDVVEIIRPVAELVDPPLDSDVVHLDGQVDEQVLGNDLSDQETRDYVSLPVRAIRPVVLVLK